MKIIIVGVGKVGRLLTQKLVEEDHDVTVIDIDKSVLSEAEEDFDVLTIEGNAASLKALRDAGASESDLLIATTDADETNLLCCLTAKKMGCKNTIARVRRQVYVQQANYLKDELGLSLAVNPEQAAAHEIFRMIQFPSFLKRESFDKGRVELVEFVVSENGPLCGKKIMDISSVLGLRALICAVERDGNVSIPNGNFVLKKDDHITVTAARTSLAKLIKKLDLYEHKIKDVLIVGCSRIAQYLADELLKSGVGIKMIDQDQKTCEDFSLKFPEVLVVCGDASRKGFIQSEGLDKVDAVVTLTGIDEENLMISLLCKHFGVMKTVTKLDRNEYLSMLLNQDLGSVVCPKELTANEIVSFVRAMSNSANVDSVIALHSMVNGKAEALEFRVENDAEYLGVPIMKLNILPNILIASITRQNEVIIPKGNDVIQMNDTVIVVTLQGNTICDLGDIFGKEAVKK